MTLPLLQIFKTSPRELHVAGATIKKKKTLRLGDRTDCARSNSREIIERNVACANTDDVLEIVHQISSLYL